MLTNLLYSHQKLLRKLGFGLIIAIVAAISIAFHGCTNVTQPDGPITLRMAVPDDERTSWAPLISQFQARHPNIVISLDDAVGSDDLKRKYVRSFNADNSDPENTYHYDIVYTDIIWLPEFVEKGWLKDLTDYFPNIEDEDFFESEIENGRYDSGNDVNRLYRIPFRTDAGILYYRQDLLEQIGESPPDTFDDLLRIAQTAKEQELVPIVYLWQGSEDEAISAMFLEVLYGHGGFWIKPEELEDESTDISEAIGLGQIEAVQAANFLRLTIETGISDRFVLNYKEHETRDHFKSGETLFMRNWPAAWAKIHEPTSQVIGKVGIQPMVSIETVNPVSTIGGWGFGIASNSRYPEEAIKAIKFLMSPSAQRQFTLSQGSVPSRESLFNDRTIVVKYNHYPKLLNIIKEYQKPRPMIPQYGEASCILQKNLRNALTSNNVTEVENNMRDAARETVALFQHGISCLNE